jgi:hypothetical protein
MLEGLARALNTLRIPTQEEQERWYLASATSRVDRERRQRQIDAGMFRTASRYY